MTKIIDDNDSIKRGCYTSAYKAFVHDSHHHHHHLINPLLATLKPQISKPSYSNTVIDGWAVIFGTARRELVGATARQAPPQVLAVPNVTAHPSMACVPTSMWHYKCLWSLKS